MILAAFKGRMVVKTYFFKQNRFERSQPGFGRMNVHTVFHSRKAVNYGEDYAKGTNFEIFLT